MNITKGPETEVVTNCEESLYLLGEPARGLADESADQTGKQLATKKQGGGGLGVGSPQFNFLTD